MDKWPYIVMTYSPLEVQEYCVRSAGWQNFRVTLKGKPTTQKLAMLKDWRDLDIAILGHVRRRCQVQIDNYINALKRGGQLNMNLEVQR